MKQGRRHWASWLFASHLATGLDSAKPRTKTTQALGDRALPDLFSMKSAMTDHDSLGWHAYQEFSKC